MLVSTSVVIQHIDNNIIHSGSGLLLSGSNYVLTSPVWLIRSAQRGKDRFSIFLQCAGNSIINHDAVLVKIVPISEMVTSVHKLLQDASLPDGDIAELCSIALLQIQKAPLQCRDNNLSNTRSPITAGSDVYVRGTPFGDQYLKWFMNSTLVGCVCGVLSDGVLFIIDCVLPVGCEGAPVYCKNIHSLIGLVLSPLATKSGYLTGLSLCYSINAITNVVQPYISGIDIPRLPALEQSTAPVQGVVSVHIGSGAWGTGVLVKDDIIITCAHVIQQETGPFTIKGQMGYQCSVMYCSNPGQAPDLAVLKINNFYEYSAHNSTLPIIPSDNYNTGDAVTIIGYGLLRPHRDDVGPLVTKGAISKIIQHNNTPVMIQTTAVIAAGSSGGILVSLNTGHPIGIVVSYVKDDTNNVTYPRLNFCVPLTLIWKPLSEYMTTKDPAVFQRFYNEQLDIKEIWQLEMPQPNMKCKL